MLCGNQSNFIEKLERPNLTAELICHVKILIFIFHKKVHSGSQSTNLVFFSNLRKQSPHIPSLEFSLKIVGWKFVGLGRVASRV